MNRVLIIDDDADLRRNLREILEDNGFSPDEASSAAEALEKLPDEKYDVILLDLMMPGMDGMDALTEIRKACPKCKIIMITAFATITNAVDAIKRGASDYISKPFKIDELLIAIKRVMEESRFEDDLKNLDMDFTLSSLSNPIRRNILLNLENTPGMRLMDLCRKLEIEDHTKVMFHLRNLKDNGIIKQDADKSYFLTKEGEKGLLCLKLFKTHLSLKD